MNIKVVTYNLRDASAEAIEKIADIVKDADVVAFQEVCTKGAHSRLFDVTVASMKKRDFTFRRFDGAFSIRNYMELLFVKPYLTIVDTVYIPFKRSLTHHGISIYSLSVKDTPESTRIFQVCTAQVESSSTVGAVVQRHQLEQLRDVVKTDTTPAILLLDTNLRSWQSLSPSISVIGNYVDAWREAGTQTSEITYDTKRNPIAELDTENACDRRDRIYVRGFECSECRLVGVDAKPTLSSHYGVSVNLKLR